MYSSQEISIELYKLSGWEEETFDWWGENKTYLAPRYSLGYLLRKLPALTGRNSNFSLQIHKWENEYHAAYLPFTDDTGLNHLYFEKADTPEGAVCKLAIELFKQGILK